MIKHRMFQSPKCSASWPNFWKEHHNWARAHLWYQATRSRHWYEYRRAERGNQGSHRRCGTKRSQAGRPELRREGNGWRGRRPPWSCCKEAVMSWLLRNRSAVVERGQCFLVRRSCQRNTRKAHRIFGFGLYYISIWPLLRWIIIVSHKIHLN